MASNLPPGVSESMIPGNRPEDVAEDAFWDKLIEKAPSGDLPEDWYEERGLVALVEATRELAYDQGFGEGRAEEQMAQAEHRDEADRLLGTNLVLACQHFECGAQHTIRDIEIDPDSVGLATIHDIEVEWPEGWGWDYIDVNRVLHCPEHRTNGRRPVAA